MEVLKQDIEKFLASSRESGTVYFDDDCYNFEEFNGVGVGCFSGRGNYYNRAGKIGGGFGCGYGDCAGDGYSNGTGIGYDIGEGYRPARDILSFNGQKVYRIDDIATLIYQVRGNYAKGAVLARDLILEPCFIARFGDYYGHGDTIHKAFEAAKYKATEEMPEDERIDLFVKEHPDLDKKYDDLFEWHHILTGSCEFGRRRWCEQHGYKPTDSITIRTFLEQTRNDYGHGVIAQVRKRYGLN